MNDYCTLWYGQQKKSQEGKGKTYTNNALRADQFNEIVGLRTLSIALSISLEITKIPYVANFILRSTVCVAMRVDYL